MITLVRKAVEDPILAVADRLHGRMKKAVLDAVAAMKGSVNMQALADAINANDFNQALAVLGVDTGFARVLQGHGVEAGIKSVRDAIQDVYLAGGKTAIGILPEKAALEGSFDLLNPKSIEFIQSYSFNLIQQVSEEARGTVRQVLHRAFTEGGHPRQQAREIREAIGLTQNQEKAVHNYRKALDNQQYHDALKRALRDGRYDAGVINAQRAGKALDQARVDKMVDRYRERYVNHRATTIARTETIRAANAGQQEIWRQAAEQGVIDHETTLRVWIVSGDASTCDECDDLDEETVELGEEFLPGVYHPPLHPNCRCTTALLFNVDKRDRVTKYSPDQPRDDYGRFGEGEGSEKPSAGLFGKWNANEHENDIRTGYPKEQGLPEEVKQFSAKVQALPDREGAFEKENPIPLSDQKLSGDQMKELDQAFRDKNYTVQEVPRGSLVSLQPGITGPQVVRMTGQKAHFSDDNLPSVVKIGNQYHVAEGNHRAALQYLAGDKTIRVHVYTLGVSKADWDESKHPRDEHGRFGAGGDSPEEKKQFATERLIRDGSKEGTSRVRVVKDSNIGIWGFSHGGSSAITGYSAKVMGIEGYTERDASKQATNLGDKFLSVIAEGQGAGETVYHGFNNSKNIEWAPGDTIRMPLTAVSGDMHHSIGYGIEYGREDNSGATVFEFPPDTAIAGYSRWDRENTKEFGHTWTEAIVAGEFRVKDMRIEHEQGYKALPVKVVTLEPVSLYNPVTSEWIKKMDLTELVGQSKDHQVPATDSSATPGEDIQKDWDESKHPRDERGRFGEGGAEPEGAARGPQTYRAPAEPEKPFESPLPKEAWARQQAENVIKEGREFMAKNVPGFTDARERAQWAKNQLDRVEAKMRTANRNIEKYQALPEEQRSSPEATAKFNEAIKEMDTMVMRAGIGQGRLHEAEADLRDKMAEWLKGAAGEIRPVKEDIKGFDPITTGKIADTIRKFETLTGGASGKYNDVKFRPLPLDDKGRARYSYNERTVWLKPGQIREKTIIHELGHWFEHNSPDTQGYIHDWLRYRTHGESLKKLDDIYPGVGYKRDEVAREDKFMNAYIGRDYDSYGVTEVASMGFEYMFRRAGEFYNRDPDHFMFTAGLISKASKMMRP